MDLFFAADKVWPLLTLGLLLLWAFTGWYWLQQRQQQALELMRLHTELTASQSQLLQQQQQQRELQQQQAQQQQHYLQLKEKYDRLTVTLQERQQHFHSQLALLQENKAQLKQEFELLANEILQRKGEDFKQQSSQSLLQLLQPLQADMKGFRDKVESIHTEELKQRAELKTELINLQKLNFAITDQAARLTNALQGQKKTQGNWGELMLENVLENSGLRAGVDYQREVSFHTEEGRRRPDVIVYLPQQKHLVIDAKTSLAAYTRYVNAEQDDERQLALRQHCQAVQDRILELADCNYYQLSGLNSPEVVFMFIPIESAYVEALKQQPLLYQQALERNVLVATPTTLLTSLNIVRQLWRFEDQNKHSAELASRAEKFYAKLTGFLESMQGVGKQLDRARESYDKAFSQLYSGKGNLIKQAAEFKDLGVAVKTEMAADLLEKAHLELPLASDE
ncbi:DNA recombination protein RmuC [Rheinheimera sp.]|uniref:DNA recombination protein RmuC n=1 Tax=Rheinheimera sp. TaxID=1869214 RepID=UPI002FDE861C